ncbi:hypothetical protein V22_24110 [Calycomorphotria hydatis]|uniref:Uncharacterized protein n=1 Tax=Calycomorphotria hydatis TaxID=2528027 RepID=A0A517T9W4_9PLAN|nr:hypothetical protein V22_24110 [Calycomorphotria hydatis]
MDHSVLKQGCGRIATNIERGCQCLNNLQSVDIFVIDMFDMFMDKMTTALNLFRIRLPLSD